VDVRARYRFPWGRLVTTLLAVAACLSPTNGAWAQARLTSVTEVYAAARGLVGAFARLGERLQALTESTGRPPDTEAMRQQKARLLALGTKLRHLETDQREMGIEMRGFLEKPTDPGWIAVRRQAEAMLTHLEEVDDAIRQEEGQFGVVLPQAYRSLMSSVPGATTVKQLRLALPAADVERNSAWSLLAVLRESMDAIRRADEALGAYVRKRFGDR